MLSQNATTRNSLLQFSRVITIRNYEKHALRVSRSYRGARQICMQACDFSRYSRKKCLPSHAFSYMGRKAYLPFRVATHFAASHLRLLFFACDHFIAYHKGYEPVAFTTSLRKWTNCFLIPAHTSRRLSELFRQS